MTVSLNVYLPYDGQQQEALQTFITIREEVNFIDSALADTAQ